MTRTTFPGLDGRLQYLYSSAVTTDHESSPSELAPMETCRIGEATPLAASQIYKDWNARGFAQPFCDFLSTNPTVFHAVHALGQQLKEAGFKKLSEREEWQLQKGGKYFVERNGSSLIAFEVGKNYKSGAGAGVVAGHVDALTAKIKPFSKLETTAGFVQLGTAPYADSFNSTWWDRDLGIAGRVTIRESDGSHVTKLVDLHEPIAHVPTLAPHFGIQGPFNKETQMVPIIGLDGPSTPPTGRQDGLVQPVSVFDASKDSFASKQPPRLVRAIANQLGLDNYDAIKNWDLELYDVQPSVIGGIDKEFIYGGRLDDKMCSWAAVQALIGSTHTPKDSTLSGAQDDAPASVSDSESGVIKCAALFDDEEIGSKLRQGAGGNFLPIVLERVVESFMGRSGRLASTMAQTYANSFLVSADVTHSVNPNFLGAYLPNHYIYLNTGIGVEADANGNMTTDGVSTALFQRVAEKSESKIQISQIRNDVRSGGTIGPMLSAATGMRAVDAGIPELSMHSIRAATGVLDPGLGVKIFKGFYDFYETVDKEFTST